MSERPELKLVPDPTLALHPTALALRQLADQIDQATKAGYLGHDAVEQTSVRDRAAVAVALGFGEAAVAVALQDIATTMRGIEPVLRRGVEAHEREVTIRGESRDGRDGRDGRDAGHYTEAPTSPGVVPSGKAAPFLSVLTTALTEPYRTILASASALILGAILSWLGVRVTEAPVDVADAPVESPVPVPVPVPPRDPVIAPIPYHRDPEPSP